MPQAKQSLINKATNMKLLHTSDWHIGQQLFNFSRIDEHRYFLSQLADIVEKEKPDIMVVSGDIYNVSNPSAEAIQLFVDALLDICSRNSKMHTFVTAGNHDSALRLEADKALWKWNNVTISGVYQRNEDGELAPEKFVHTVDGVGIVAAVPYFNPRFTSYAETFNKIDAEVERINTNGLPVVYMAHASVGSGSGNSSADSSIGGIDFIKLADFGSRYDYLALGHIHKPMFISGSDGHARYCGSPIAVSFDETHTHCVDILEITHGQKPEIKTIPIIPLRNVQTLPTEPKPLKEVLRLLEELPSECQDYIRLNVLVETHLDSDAQVRASGIAAEKQCRLCQLMTTKSQRPEERKRSSMTISEFREVKPIDIAKIVYKQKYNEDMPADIVDLLQGVIDEVEEEHRK